MRRFAISGVTYSGNLGGQAMLLASLKEVRRVCANPRFCLLSVFPAKDAALSQDRDVEIVPTSPLALVGVYLPLSILAWPVARLGGTRWLLGRIRYFRRLMDCELLLDLGGIAFVDGRGLPLLAYNTACCLPAIVLGVPVIKLSQALGPFHQPLNRMLARLVLDRCARVFARGSETAAHLRELGIARAAPQPDVTFALSVSAAQRTAARARLTSMGLGEDVLGIAPSEVMRRYCEDAGVNIIECLHAAACWAWGRGANVAIIVHSRGKPGSKNDDVPLCRELASALGGRAALLDDLTDAVQARALIGCCSIFVGCRFHAVVGALAMGVPAIALGWSHKYAELLDDFGLGQFALDAKSLYASKLIAHLEAVEADRAPIAHRVSATAARLGDEVRNSYASLLEESRV